MKYTKEFLDGKIITHMHGNKYIISWDKGRFSFTSLQNGTTYPKWMDLPNLQKNLDDETYTLAGEMVENNYSIF